MGSTVMRVGIFARSGAVAFIATLATLTACVSSPRSGQELERKDTPIRFEGLAPRADAPVEVQLYDRGDGSWETVGELMASLRAPVADEAGRDHYRFSQDLPLPVASKYWRASDDRSMHVKLRLVQDGKPLASMDDESERCLRDARSAGRTSAEALGVCASGDSPSTELVVPGCGGAGDSCCAAAVGASLPACMPWLSCIRDRCQLPPYAAPWIPQHQQDIAVAPGHEVRDAWLEIDDRSGGVDTRVPLVKRFEVQPGVRIERPQPNVARFTVDLPLYTPGENRFRLRGRTARRGLSGRFTTPFRAFSYDLPRDLGQLGPGHFRLPSRHFPRTAALAAGGVCKDADADGLCDLWENAALHQLRPRLHFDRADGLFDGHGDVVRLLASVLPVRRGGRDYVLFAHVVLMSRDYGVPKLNVFDHPGDTEAWGMVMRVDPDASLRWVATVSKGHGCVTCKPRFRSHSQAFSKRGVPLVYVERDKHGLWPSKRACKRSAAFRCRGDRTLRPPAVNVGDRRAGQLRALVDNLSQVPARGPHASLSGHFSGEAVWSAKEALVAGRFCGGIRAGCTKKRSANLPGAVISALQARLMQAIQ